MISLFSSYYTEWVLVEASEQLLEFSFLEDTLCVNISLGSQLCHLQGVLENHPRSLESIDIVPIQRGKFYPLHALSASVV